MAQGPLAARRAALHAHQRRRCAPPPPPPTAAPAAQAELTRAAADEPGHVDLVVKRYPDGKASTHLHALAPGQTLLFAAPLKGPAWTANAAPHVVLIAGGAGITPAYQLARGILHNPADRTAVTLVHAVDAERDLLLRAELAAWERAFPGRFSAVFAVKAPASADAPADAARFHRGYVTAELLRAAIPAVGEPRTKVFICGPPAMEKSLVGDAANKGVLEGLGYRKDQICKF